MTLHRSNSSKIPPLFLLCFCFIVFDGPCAHCSFCVSSKTFSPPRNRSLLGLAPTTIEAETLHKYDGPCGVLDLGKAERFCMALLRIPRYRERIRCFMYVMRFQELVKDLEHDLGTVLNACERVLTSKALVNALNVLVALGNFLNLYSVNGEAEGVTIDSLNKLKQVKSYGSQTTALHYFTLVVQDRSKDIFNLSTEVGDCRGAASCVLSQLTAELKILRKGFVALKNEHGYTTKMMAVGQEEGGKVALGASSVPPMKEEKASRKEISSLEQSEMNRMFLDGLETFLNYSDLIIASVEKMQESVVEQFEQGMLWLGDGVWGGVYIFSDLFVFLFFGICNCCYTFVARSKSVLR